MSSCIPSIVSHLLLLLFPLIHLSADVQKRLTVDWNSASTTPTRVKSTLTRDKEPVPLHRWALFSFAGLEEDTTHSPPESGLDPARR